ncbi:MAG: N utilization substance protein B, partial [Draconibacterium sp.]|nr:N utilization substance protein B [Draconibacterium sp.]
RNFINGILDKALKDLKSSGKIGKVGRGLIGE